LCLFILILPCTTVRATDAAGRRAGRRPPAGVAARHLATITDAVFLELAQGERAMIERPHRECARATLPIAVASTPLARGARAVALPQPAALALPC
jgi:hypothetical protein